jgi:hypothetical protein
MISFVIQCQFWQVRQLKLSGTGCCGPAYYIKFQGYLWFFQNFIWEGPHKLFIFLFLNKRNKGFKSRNNLGQPPTLTISPCFDQNVIRRECREERLCSCLFILWKQFLVHCTWETNEQGRGTRVLTIFHDTGNVINYVNMKQRELKIK